MTSLDRLPFRFSPWVAVAASAAALLSACGGGDSTADSTASPNSTEPVQTLSAEAALGRRIFFDASLSASGQMSCATCHDPTNGHTQTNDLGTQLGGPGLDVQGKRLSMPASYLHTAPVFSVDADGTPKGGMFWFGAVDTLEQQALGPFLNPVEMANTGALDVLSKIASSAYAEDFKKVYGQDAFTRHASDDTRDNPMYVNVGKALGAFEREAQVFHPYDSKYDEVLRGNATLSTQEQRGLDAFNRADKGNCASCHTSARSAGGEHPLFTNFGYYALGVARNAAYTANADATYYDLGLCDFEPGGRTPSSHPTWCGKFKTPSLRNVALRMAFFHNGQIKTLREAVNFHVRRDTHPAQWYPQVAGVTAKFNDLPAAYHGNVVTTAPFNRTEGGTPALSSAEVDDVLAFLATLSDGYVER